MAGPTVSGKKRLFVALGGIAFIFILLIIRLFWIQIIDGKRLSEMCSTLCSTVPMRPNPC